MIERPGIMIYFDQWESIIKTDDATLAGLFRAAVLYGKYGEIPNFDDMAAVLWGIIRPAIDRDAKRYAETQKKRQYAVYCREEKKAENSPLPFDEWCQKVSLDNMRYPNTSLLSYTESYSDIDPLSESSINPSPAHQKPQKDGKTPSSDTPVFNRISTELSTI